MRPKKFELGLHGKTYRDWKVFEKRIEGEANCKGHVCIKIPERNQKVPTGSGRIRIQLVKSDVDFVLVCNGVPYFFDAKSCGERTFNLQKFCYGPEKIHQLLQLQCIRDRGCRAGYMIWWGAYELISWVPIEVIERVHDRGDLSLIHTEPGVMSQSENQIINFERLLI